MSDEYTSTKELVSHYQDIRKRYYKPAEQPKSRFPCIPPENHENERVAISMEMHGMRKRIEALEFKLCNIPEYYLRIRAAETRLDLLEGFDPQQELGNCPHHPQARRLTVESIIKLVCKTENITREMMVGKSRQVKVIPARHMLYYLAVNLSGRSLPFIGRMIGGRDHTTIFHGCNKIAKRRKVDAALDAKLKVYEKFLLETQTPPGGPDGAGNVTTS